MGETCTPEGWGSLGASRFTGPAQGARIADVLVRGVREPNSGETQPGLEFDECPDNSTTDSVVFGLGGQETLSPETESLSLRRLWGGGGAGSQNREDRQEGPSLQLGCGRETEGQSPKPWREMSTLDARPAAREIFRGLISAAHLSPLQLLMLGGYLSSRRLCAERGKQGPAWLQHRTATSQGRLLGCSPLWPSRGRRESYACRQEGVRAQTSSPLRTPAVPTGDRRRKGETGVPAGNAGHGRRKRPRCGFPRAPEPGPSWTRGTRSHVNPARPPLVSGPLFSSPPLSLAGAPLTGSVILGEGSVHLYLYAGGLYRVPDSVGNYLKCCLLP